MTTEPYPESLTQFLERKNAETRAAAIDRLNNAKMQNRIEVQKYCKKPNHLVKYVFISAMIALTFAIIITLFN